jgi:hypothetical protein
MQTGSQISKIFLNCMNGLGFMNDEPRGQHLTSHMEFGRSRRYACLVNPATVDVPLLVPFNEGFQVVDRD